MSGAASRASLAEAVERLEAVLSTADLTTLGEELFGITRLLDREPSLRRALSDPSRDGEEKAQLIRILLEGKISEPALELAADVVRQRWSRPRELADAFERLAVIAEAARAESEGRIDDLEDEIFRFGRVIDREPQLRNALTSPRPPAEQKRELVGALLEGKVTPSTSRLISEVVTDSRGRSLERALEEYGRLVAQRRDRLVALVRTPTDLSEDQRTRLVAALSAAYGHDVYLNIEVDPGVLGGISVQIGDELIDGTVARRLDDVRRRITSG
ncbi:F0F1 ATP synthase subunit delta [Actinomadura sp. HBU206391]|uniref:F0F1 ATP synthase subunit delta n=1 Tax=Actinomadura sp. HBU206391 TaxID=2731692 RepID=UPI00164FC0CC|nr:F0F1 ATP synthase subunit delta [Actinomadura sp. HBU206391]MBC6458057.1 F0F1 ATP synthase subunit delta [Actinomadura sp. HBU206391]